MTSSDISNFMLSAFLQPLSRLYAMWRIDISQGEDGAITLTGRTGNKDRTDREAAVSIARLALTAGPDSVYTWYSALEQLADKLGVSVDRNAIKDEVIAVLREARPR